MRKTSLRYGDGLGGQACVAMNLAPLAGQTPPGPGGDVAGQTTPHESGRNNTTGGEPPGVSNIVKMGKNIFAKFEGYNWLPVEMSPARHWAPVWRNANLRDVPPSKCCVSGQRLCSAAISSKSTGSAAAVAATVPVVGVGVET